MKGPHLNLLNFSNNIKSPRKKVRMLAVSSLGQDVEGSVEDPAEIGLQFGLA